MAAKEGGTSNYFYERYETDALGRDTDVRLGEVTDETFVYDRASGYLKEIAASASSGIQDLSFTYDEVGNLLTRTNDLIGKTETFDYDALDRLTSSQVSGQSAVTIAYSDSGRITSKSDVGSYTYGDSSHPYAVTAANGVSYAYDANGRMTSRGGDAITWYSYDLAKKIVSGSQSTEFWYGVDRQRYKQAIGSSCRSHYHD